MSFLRRLREFWAVDFAPSRARTRAKSRPRTRAVRVEQLEGREMLSVDLLGNKMTVWESGGDPYVPGDAVSAQWQVANQGFDMAWSGFDVQFYLSRDPTVSSADYLLKWGRFAPGFPGLYAYPVVDDSFALPAASHPVWAGSGTYYIGMLIDPWNEVPESNESNNGGIPDYGRNVAPVSIQTDTTLPGDTDLDDLPQTGVSPGAVLNAVFTGLRTRLKQIAAAQDTMRERLKKAGVPAPAVGKELRSLSASIAVVGKQLSKLTSGKAASVRLGPGVVFDRDALDLTERYLKYIFSGDSASYSYVPLPTIAGRPSADPGDASLGGASGSPPINDWRYWFPSVAEKYDNVKKKWDNANKRISDFVEGVKNAPSEGIKWLSGLLGQSAETMGRAQQEAKSVTEGGSSFPERVSELEQQLAPQTTEDQIARLDSLLTGAPPIFSMAGSRLKTLMRETQDSVQNLEDQVVNLETWARNQAALGRWKGTLTRTTDGLSGTIDIYFKPSSARGNTVSGVLGHSFYINRRRSGRTTGHFKGYLDEFNVFRGTATVRNSSGRGTYDIAWTLSDGSLGGTLYQGESISFSVTRAR